MLGSIKSVSNLAALATSGLALAGGPAVTGWGSAGPSSERGPDAHRTVEVAADRRDNSRFNIDLSFGNGGIRFGREHARPARAEVAPCRLELRAFQVGDQVLIIAEGENRGGGFSTFFERCDEGGSRGATIVLRNHGPARGHFGSQHLSAFEVTGGFGVRGHLREVRVLVGDQVHCVRVDHVSSLR
ncbi:MAG: hypothetical protein AB7K52_08435 [Phycisphaerales bacterium]